MPNGFHPAIIMRTMQNSKLYLSFRPPAGSGPLPAPRPSLSAVPADRQEIYRKNAISMNMRYISPAMRIAMNSAPTDTTPPAKSCETVWRPSFIDEMKIGISTA